MSEQKTYTLTQLCTSIKNLIERSLYEKYFWITCEISGINEKNGHRFLELVDTHDNETTAKASGIIWRSTYQRISDQYKEETDKIIKKGNKVLVQVEVTFKEVHGLRLDIKNVDPSYTYGDIEKRRAETIKKLQDLGLIEKNKRIKLPVIIQKLAIVGSPNTSGYKDVLDHLDNNPYRFRFLHQLFSATVQGDNAVSEIISGIRMAQLYDFDIIALIRGGGSKLDLDIFNNFSLCETIANCRLPVITGIGHESDISVADLVSNINVKTPTAVADFVIVRAGDFSARMEKKTKDVLIRAQRKLSLSKERILNNSGLFKALVTGTIGEHNNKISLSKQSFFSKLSEILQFNDNLLKDNSNTCENLTLRLIQRQRNLLSISLEKIKGIISVQTQSSSQRLRIKRNSLQSLSIQNYSLEPSKLLNQNERLKINISNTLKFENNRIKVDSKKLELLSPLNTLKRGYSITKKGGKVIKEISDVKLGDTILSRTSKLLIESTVQKVDRYE